MRSLTIRAIVFLLLSGLFYLGIFAVLSRIDLRGRPLVYCFDENLTTLGSLHRASLDREAGEPFDIKVFGSSHAYRGYDPRIFEARIGQKLFNAGSSAQSISDTYHLFRQQAEEHPASIYLIDVFVDVFEADNIESGLALIRNTDSERVMWDIFKEEKDVRLLNTLSLRYLLPVDTSYYQNKEYVVNGFSSRDKKMADPQVQKERDFDPRQKAVKRFRDLLDYATTKGITLVLVNQPRPVETSARRNEQFVEFIERELSTHDHVFIDYSMSHELETSTYFYDFGHMNQTGVDYFNHRLIDDLIDRGLIRSTGDAL